MSHIHVMVKPTGSKCNLDCDYCFYLEKEKLYPGKSQFKMTEELLEIYIKQNISAQPDDVEFYTFSWQGGEPTLMGLEFFKKAVDLQRKWSKGKRCENTFQTNGVLLDDKWCEFLHDHDFLVGLSIDGNKAHHDQYRKTRAGRGTHDQVIAAIKRLEKYNVQYNTLVVLHQGNVDEPLALYRYLRSLNVKHMQFIPLVERIAQDITSDGLTLVNPDYLGLSQVSPWSIGPLQYANFLNTVFDEWVQNDIGDIFVNMFETTLGLAIGEPSNTCVFSKTCGNAIVIEHNGDVYACDHFVYPEYKLGNIQDQTINTMGQSNKQRRFGKDKVDNLSVECKSCRYLSLCNGGCPKHRFDVAKNGIPNKNYLCDGYKHYFEHIIPHMKEIYKALVTGESPESLKAHFTRKFSVCV